MITEDYVSFETAKLLKEKGFEGVINAYYHIWDNGNRICSVQEFSHSEAPHLYIPAPTLQMAMKWLREMHNLHCDIGYDFRLGWHIRITSLKEVVIDHDIEMKTYLPYYKTVNYSSYEEACEGAIKYCLENLI